MWTNVFKIGGLHQISWFQFLPSESDLSSLPEKSVKAEQKDAATLLVLLSHLQLQKEGFFSTWTNSFVGPWDPSQGVHNPDEKIKLWLFLPGRHSSVPETVQAAVSRLRVVGSGLWVAPGESEEVAVALSQALRNCIERALRGISYMRYGDVFTKCHPFSQSGKHSRRVQPAIEFIFAATEEAIFVHVIISAKHIRTLSSDDMEKVLGHRSSQKLGEKLPVIVAPHGMRGKLSGCCPSDLVKQVYFSSSKSKPSNGLTVLNIPSNVAQASGCQLRGQSCYVEVTLGSPGTGDKAARLNPNNPLNYHHTGSPTVAHERDDQKNESPLDQFRVFERTFIYPAEAVVVPVMQTSFARSSLKRFWLQSWTGASLFGSCFLMNCSGFGRSGNEESISGSWMDSNGIRSQHSSSNSNNSSISSISSTSSESDHQMTSGGGDFEADADSLTCRQAGLFSNDQHENGDHKQVSKRPRTGTTGSFGGGTVINATVEISSANDQVRSFWDWDSEEKGEMDIQILLSDFGDFGDFFENDTLPFGEPPGTAESQAIVYSVLDCGDVNGSPCTGAMDVTDQLLLPGLDFPSFDSLNPLPMAVSDESQSKQQKVMKDAWSSVPANYSSALSAGECDTLSKAEAVMTFAPEYTAVETPSSELLVQTFRCPYLPISRKVESSNSSPNTYLYGATPPSSCLTGTEEKPGLSQHAKSCSDGHESAPAMNNKKYYTYVRWGKGQSDGKLSDYKSNMTSSEGLRQSSAFSGFSSKNAVKSVKRERTESNTEPKNIFMSLEIVFASEVECILFQASMCRIRHMLVSSSNLVPVGLSSITGNTSFEHLRGDTFTVSDKTSNRFEVKKKESIPIRIAGDVDGGMLDGPLNAPIGVWRSVGVPKGVKPTISLSIENNPSFHNNSFSEENRLMYGQRQPLQELLDAMVLLVQQATSFVDVALDAEYGDGPFGWLALEEQCRRGFSCGPSMVHAGCGGLLASCHSLDIAGVELLDPLSANVHASSVIGLLHSDIKVALKSAFGILDGPLLVTDWCKGRSQLGDTGNPNDGYSGESASGDAKDSSSAITLAVGEPISPTNSSGSSCLRDGVRVDETSQRRLNQESGCSDSEQQMNFSRLRPTLLVLPMPSILVGYQDDWLKTSASAIQLWDKAPLEPYALPKPMTYYVVCPDIDPLASAAADFFQQLGTVYETCKLGTHIPQNMGAQMELSSGKWASSGFVMIDCPQSMKIESGKASIMGSISDYLLALSNAWDMRSFLKSLSNVIKSLRLGSNSTANQKEGSSGPGMVIYVVCPFPEPVAVLQTMIESSVALGSTIVSSDKEKRSSLHIQVGRALSSSAAVDEASLSNFPTLSGFSLPKLVLQIVTVEAILRVTSPALNELVLLKEISFTVYNKSRRLSRVSSNDAIHAPGISVRPQSTLMPMTSPISGMWKDCIAPRITGSLPREGEIDTSMRGAWDNNWQASRTGGLNYDQNRLGDKNIQDDVRYLFEPLFILAEPGSVEQGVSPTILGHATLDSYRSSVDDGNSGVFLQNSTSVGADIGSSSLLDGSDSDGFGHGQQKTTSLHCCYGWTEDWRWLVCVWTDSRGEFLDSQIFPFGGIGSRQDTKGLHCLFVQVLHQSCQILSSSSPDSGSIKPRDIVIARIGSFYELERQEWQKAIYLVGGNEVKKWPLQLRRSVPDGMSPNNGSSLHQQEMSLIQERTLPSSQNPAMYNTQTKSSGFMKGGLGQLNARKQLGGSATVDSSRGLFQWVQSISLVGVSVDHSLHLILQADTSSPGGGGQGASGTGPLGYLEGYSPVKSLGSTSTSYILIPSPSMHFLPPTPLQLPMCLTSESPPLAHLLHSKGSAIPLSTGFVVSKAVPSILKDTRSNMKEEWPSVLSVGLVDYYGSSNIPPEKMVRGSIKHGRSLNTDVRDHEIETHLLLESVAAELHALSWMTASPAYLERRTALPFHCDMILRLRRLIHYADREICQKQDKVQM